ncbi:SH3 domain-containing protein [Sphingomonas sp. GB1N7]|uniref:SH3 domain-containing protein n=1 Tax=Parasphingomonas caseinilytica TaxID=3096158 RepID=UPI002FC5AACE
MAISKVLKGDVLEGLTAFAVTAALLVPASPSSAAPAETAATLAKCASPHGSVAITDGDTQGWTQFDLSSPRPMLAAMIQQSGCFTLHDPAAGKPADFLISAVAGSKEEIDKTMDAAKSVVAQGLVRSGAASQLIGRVPMGGALFSAFSGFGGKKKTISAGLRIVSPANGQTLISSVGESRKSTVNIIGASDWVAASQGAMGQYATSGNGKMLSAAFLEAFNSLVAQAGALRATPVIAAGGTMPVAATAPPYIIATDTNLWPQAKKAGAPVRALRASSEVMPTGKKSGLFVEAADKYGNTGWVSVEDLR